MLSGGWTLMPMLGSDTDDRVVPSARPRERSRLWRGIRWSTFALCVAGPLVLAAGFLWFISRVPADEIVLDRNADGIVVLTGGASRINDAIELLAAGRGRRLLISGLSLTTNPIDISRLNPEFARWVSCCVDFDRSVNTLGNAIETRHWAESRGFQSLIVVTSSYHMPRAMIEIAHQLPHVVLVPFPVISDRLRAEPWWTNSVTTRLMVSEYLKYIVAQVRLRLPGASEPA
jgi:uncharacterized SAM-binding protein YcdF (DUF218 family)